ncbi:hypothetical protein EJ110_NYTH01150 [Nymphaea thermarum]|nr:hypothetical protein EJ110_NYTH01150 [Nymphaea thermarum]
MHDEFNVWMVQIKGTGYVLHTEFVLHNLDEETKEQHLFYHNVVCNNDRSKGGYNQNHEESSNKSLIKSFEGNVATTNNTIADCWWAVERGLSHLPTEGLDVVRRSQQNADHLGGGERLPSTVTCKAAMFRSTNETLGMVGLTYRNAEDATKYSSPPRFLDIVEVDMISAAVKGGMEEARAKLKLPKEFTDKRRNSLKTNKKLVDRVRK